MTAEQQETGQGAARAGDIVLVCDPVVLAPSFAPAAVVIVEPGGQFGVPPAVAPGLVVPGEDA